MLAFSPAGPSDALARVAESLGLAVEQVGTLGALFERLRADPWVAVVLSLARDLVDESVARRVGEEEHCGALMLSAPGISLERAVLMERAGAVALLHEPLREEELASRLQGVLAEGPEVALPQIADDGEGAPTLIGSSPGLSESLQVLARVAPTSATVLITGESGTGKELMARALHWASDRADGPFVAVNCAAIPEQLLESELFGHEKGAFTGAVARRVGRFERARGGTLFLDEIGDMSPVLQAKVLRALEERTIERVGGEETLTVDARIVAATNQLLDERIAEGEFREDLYHRLAVVELVLPPLRERNEDVRELALHFAARFARRYQRPVRSVTVEALRRLRAHPWPGNVRELRNVMDRAVLLANGGTIRSGDLRLGAGTPRMSPLQSATGSGYPPTLSLEEVESDHIRRVLDDVGGHMGNAAAVLGIHRNTLTRKVQDYGIEAGGS